MAFFVLQITTYFGKTDISSTFEYMYVTVEKELPEFNIKIELYPTNDQLCEEYQIPAGYVVLDVLARERRNLIPVHPKIVEHCIDMTIESLLVDEQYEICSVLRDVKLEYISQK